MCMCINIIPVDHPWDDSTHKGKAVKVKVTRFSFLCSLNSRYIQTIALTILCNLFRGSSVAVVFFINYLICSNRSWNVTRGPQALRSLEYQRLCTDFLSKGRIFAYQQTHYNNKLKNKMCLWNTNAPNNGQFQRWSRSKGQISWSQ